MVRTHVRVKFFDSVKKKLLGRINESPELQKLYLIVFFRRIEKFYFCTCSHHNGVPLNPLGPIVSLGVHSAVSDKFPKKLTFHSDCIPQDTCLYPRQGFGWTHLSVFGLKMFILHQYLTPFNHLQATFILWTDMMLEKFVPCGVL